MSRQVEEESQDMDDEQPPLYWFCNSCEDEAEAGEICCDDGEIEPAYPES